jgi:hypothetical protein
MHPGSTLTATSGNINFGEKNVTFYSGSTLYIGLRRCATSSNPGGTQIKGINRLTMNGTVSVYLYDTYEPVEGDSMKIWESTTFTGTPKFDLPTLPGGLYWDTSRISEGWLFVAYDPTAIDSIPADADVQVSVLTMNGTTVARYTCPMGSAEAQLRQSALPKGIYMLKISAGQKAMTKKVMK